MNFQRSRALVLAFAAAAALAGAAPQAVQAQGLFFEFGFGIDEHRHWPFRLCLLTDSQLRRAIERQGYHDIYLNVPNDHRIQVRATKGDWVYLLVVNSCTGRILDRERLRRAR